MNKFLLLLITLFYLPCYGQNEMNFVSEMATNYVPGSPNVGNLLRFGNIPVNMFTGTAQFSLPLYTIKVKDFAMPISLSYQGSGVKVEEIAPSTGMGWVFNIGGVISKTIRGLDDDVTDGYPNGTTGVKVNKYAQGQLTSTEKAAMNYSMAHGEMDGEPDMFSYNFAGFHGRFIFKPDGSILQLEGDKLNVTRVNNNFIIIDPRGNKYYFNDREETQNFAQYSASGSQSKLDSYTLISSWYLSQIILKSGENITFQYISSTISTSYQPGQSLYILQTVQPATDCQGNAAAPNYLASSSKNTTKITQKKISKVIFPAGVIDVTYQGVDRTDLAGDKALEKIAVSSSSSGVIEDYTLSYKYFSGRLFLDKVLAKSMPKPYQFFYDESGGLPSRESKGQDFWGFSNGKTGNSTLIPKSSDPKQLSSSNFYYSSGADREPNFSSMKIGLLTGVNYPTGGETKFVYESHDYGNISGQTNILDTIRQYTSESAYVSGRPDGTWSEVPFHVDFTHEVTIISTVTGPNTRTRLATASGDVLFSQVSSINGGTVSVTHKMFLGPGDYKVMAFNYESEFIVNISASYKKQTSYTLSKKRQGGGARLSEIIDFSSPGVISSKRSYKYVLGEDTTRSSGILVSTCMFEYLEKRSGVISNCVVGSTYDAVYNVRSSTPAVPLYTTSGSHVEYREVIETYYNGAGNGKTVNTYMSSMEAANRDINVYTYPFLPSISKEYKRGQVLNSKIYKEGSNTPLKEIINEYQTLPSSDAIYGLTVRFDRENPQIPSSSTYDYNTYFLYRDFYALKNSTERFYENGGSYETKSSYTYDNINHYQLTKMSRTKSDGSKEVLVTTYPDDYASGTAFIDNMKSAGSHLVAYPIEQVRYKEVGTAQTILSGTITKYLTGGKGLVDQVLELETPTPLALSAFKFSNRAQGSLPSGSTGATTFAPHGTYATRLTYSNYDAFGNAQQVTPAFGAPTTYIWSYGGQYPVAEIKNAGFTAVQTAMGGAAALTTFTASSPIETDLRTKFNGIRASLPNSSLSYYTYKPLIGMTSSTDPSGRTTYYSYDGFGRLQTVKDTQLKTKETFNYNYRNQ